MESKAHDGTPTTAARRAKAVTARVALLAVLALACAAVPAAAARADGGRHVSALTRNVYLGTGLTNREAATTFPDFVDAVSQDWANVVANDFPRRAKAATEIQFSPLPDVVGLQEVSLWRDQLVSDAVQGNRTPNATHVVYDFLPILQAELAARGIPYTAVSTSTNADAEAPRTNPASPTGFTDVRVTDRDVTSGARVSPRASRTRMTGATRRSSRCPRSPGPCRSRAAGRQSTMRSPARPCGSSTRTSKPRPSRPPHRCRSPKAPRRWRSSVPAPTQSSPSATSTPRPTDRRRRHYGESHRRWPQGCLEGHSRREPGPHLLPGRAARQPQAAERAHRPRPDQGPVENAPRFPHRRAAVPALAATAVGVGPLRRRRLPQARLTRPRRELGFEAAGTGSLMLRLTAAECTGPAAASPWSSPSWQHPRQHPDRPIASECVRGSRTFWTLWTDRTDMTPGLPG